jgi:hypothetical protein
MRYALLIRQDKNAAISAQERSRRAAGLAAFQAGMRARGALMAGAQLQPAETAATVQCWDGGDIVISNGPFAGAGEQIAGFLVVDCADRGEAVRLATSVPAAWYGTVEVRPVREAGTS